MAPHRRFASDPWARRALAFVAVTTLLRLLFASCTSISDTEAYYVGWARWPSLSYYDHPPLVAWTTWLASHLGRGALAVRIVPVVCMGAFSLLVYRLAGRMFSGRVAFFAMVLLAVLPAFAGLGMLVNPESLLAPLWVLWLCALWDLRDRDEPWRPLALGAIVGLGFLAKYTALLCVPVSLAWVATTREARRWLGRSSFWAGWLFSLAVASPVVVWNAVRGFPSVRFHLVERASSASLGTYLSRTVDMLGYQIALFHPLVFPAFLATAVFCVHRARGDARYRLLALASLPTFAFLFGMMVHVRDAEPHWTMVAFVPLGVALVALLDESFEPRVARVYVTTVVGTSGVGLVIVWLHMTTPILVDRLPRALYDPDGDVVNEMFDWHDVAAAVRRRASALGPGAIVASHRNVLCGHLDYALDDTPHVHCLSDGRTEFDFVGRGAVSPDEPVVYVDTAHYPRDPAVALAGRPCTLADRVEVRRGASVIQDVRVWSCPVLRQAEDREQAMR